MTAEVKGQGCDGNTVCSCVAHTCTHARHPHTLHLHTHTLTLTHILTHVQFRYFNLLPFWRCSKWVKNIILPGSLHGGVMVCAEFVFLCVCVCVCMCLCAHAWLCVCLQVFTFPNAFKRYAIFALSDRAIAHKTFCLLLSLLSSFPHPASFTGHKASSSSDPPHYVLVDWDRCWTLCCYWITLSSLSWEQYGALEVWNDIHLRSTPDARSPGLRSTLSSKSTRCNPVRNLTINTDNLVVTEYNVV